MTQSTRVRRISVEHDVLLRDLAERLRRERGVNVSTTDASKILTQVIRRENILERVKFKKLKPRGSFEFDYKFF